MQLLVKEGDSVGLIFCCHALKQNLHLSAKTGFAVIMSECILELLGHCAAADSPSRTLVFNGRVFSRSTRCCAVSWATYLRAKQPTTMAAWKWKINENPASPVSGNTCHPGGMRSSWACSNGGRAGRGTNKNPDLKGYAKWAHRAPYIGIFELCG